ncbi:MAG: hypothetical protein QOI53_3484, partial [Verrucomicrobiota bacterium]|nr:hypothetical protein [Verrucomicrobiota bacterium]
ERKAGGQKLRGVFEVAFVYEPLTE